MKPIERCGKCGTLQILREIQFGASGKIRAEVCECEAQLLEKRYKLTGTVKEENEDEDKRSSAR